MIELETPARPIIDSTQTSRVISDQCVELPGIGRKGYETVLRLRGKASRPKLIYLDGDLLLVSPATPHERLNHRVGFFIDQIILNLRIHCFHAGSRTFRDQGKRGGIEGDHTCYLANEARVRGKMKIDLDVDPPPDLAIEVVHTHSAKAALKVYRRLGDPEVWVLGIDRVRFLVRQQDGQYLRSASSLAFPFLTSDEVQGWLLRPFGEPNLEWMEEVHRWVIEVLVPRVTGA